MDDTLPAHAGDPETRPPGVVTVRPARLGRRRQRRSRPHRHERDRHDRQDQHDRPPDTAPPQWHRGMTLLATISLFIGTRKAWSHGIVVNPPVAGAISVCYAGILICGVLALSVRGRRALARVDAGVLAVAIALLVLHYRLDSSAGDEGVFTAQAAREILRGHPVYGRPWPWLFEDTGIGITKTMSGGGDFTYAYPPLAALLTAPVSLFVHSASAATLVTTAALLVGTVVLWRLVPAPWRPAVTAVCLGFGLLPGYARSGYPALVAFALLVPVVVRWPSTGAGGRLGRYGALRAVCLGAACASQQLAWFLLPFLLVGIHAVRRGELGGRAALGVVARYCGLAALAWVLINAYFAVQDFGAWMAGTLLPMTQGAILRGQGAIGISYYFTGGSSRLDFYSYSSVLLLFGLVAALALLVRRLGPALTVLPWLPFYLATRSQDGYFLLMTPLWLAAAATVPGSALANAWQPVIPRLAGSRRVRAALALGLLAPALACAGVAAASPPPLRMSLTPRLTDWPRRGITSVVVRAVNTTGHTLVPHFACRVSEGASAWWTVGSGPAALAPHASAEYVVKPPGDFRGLPGGKHPRIYLIAVTDKPMTITSVRIPLTGSGR
ncbi:hypothetical protein [Streptomyces sp. NPDC088725]|uniref:hypothetical protein n=1 Tax=Streptomyces sp. NPDC088725 TaxID=3365873 RepID=UPI003818270B